MEWFATHKPYFTVFYVCVARRDIRSCSPGATIHARQHPPPGPWLFACFSRERTRRRL